MTYRLAEMLSSFSTLASMIAIAVIGLACHRHRKWGGDKCFGVTAWIALLYLLLIGIPFTVHWVANALAASGSYSPGVVLYTVLAHCRQIADGLWFALFVVFAAGIWRTARKLPGNSADSPSEGPAAQPQD